MSDYLANLTAKSFGWIPVIRPRLPFLFENSPAAAESVFETASYSEHMQERTAEPQSSNLPNARHFNQPEQRAEKPAWSQRTSKVAEPAKSFSNESVTQTSPTVVERPLESPRESPVTRSIVQKVAAPAKPQPQGKNAEMQRAEPVLDVDELEATEIPAAAERTPRPSREVPMEQTAHRRVIALENPAPHIHISGSKRTETKRAASNSGTESSTPPPAAERNSHPSPQASPNEIVFQRLMSPANPLPEIQGAERRAATPAATDREPGSVVIPTVVQQTTPLGFEPPKREVVVKGRQQPESPPTPPHKPAPSPRITSILPAIVSAPLTDAIRPRMTTHAGRRQPVGGDPTLKPPSAPAIHVTIGRIDVRAVSQDFLTPPRKNGRTSAMTWGEYLRQRNGEPQ